MGANWAGRRVRGSRTAEMMLYCFTMKHTGLKPVAIVVGSVDGRPAAFIRAALLVQALVLVAVFVPLIVNVPPRQHAIRVDLVSYPLNGAAADHLVEVDTSGRVSVDGREQAGLVELRMALDLILVEPGAAIELRPHPEARYEDMIEALAVLKRAGADDLRIAAEDEAVAGRFAL